MDKAIMAANERQIYFTNDDEEIRAYEMREMALMDERARISYATNEGLTQGIAQGRREGLTEGRREGLTEGRREGLIEGREEGLTEGRREGLTEGLKKGQEEVIELLSQGLSVEEIKMRLSQAENK